MPKVIFDQAQAVAAVGEREAAECRSMCGCLVATRHARPPRRWKAPELTRERLATFGDEQPRERVGAARHVSLDRAEFIAGDGMLDIQPTLETPDSQTRVSEINFIAA